MAGRRRQALFKFGPLAGQAGDASYPQYAWDRRRPAGPAPAGEMQRSVVLSSRRIAACLSATSTSRALRLFWI